MIKNYIIFWFLIITTFLFAEDGLKEKFTKVQMNINHDSYVIFEEECFVLCDRETDEYLVEITPETDLFIRSKKININSAERDLLTDYYLAQRTLFSRRNSIGAKGIKIGIESAKLAAKAVGGAIGLVVSGFDENVESDFEKEMQEESEKIEYHANNIERDAEEIDDSICEINDLEQKLCNSVSELRSFDLHVEKDELGSFNID